MEKSNFPDEYQEISITNMDSSRDNSDNDGMEINLPLRGVRLQAGGMFNVLEGQKHRLSNGYVSYFLTCLTAKPLVGRDGIATSSRMFETPI